MSLKDKLRKKRAEVQKRHKKAITNQKQASARGSIFDISKMPKSVRFWKPDKEVTHIIDIIPWFASIDINSSIRKDDYLYTFDYWVHKNIGVNKMSYICPSKTHGERCPICEYIAKRLSEGRLSDKDYKALPHPKRRTAYNVWVHTNEEEENKGIQIWDVPHFFFEEEIVTLSENPRGGGQDIPFSSVFEDGKSIAFIIKKSGTFVGAGGKQHDAFDYKGHRFIDREEELPDEIVEAAIPLEAYVDLHPDYKEMKDTFYSVVSGADMSDVPEKEDDEEDDIPDFDEDDEEAPFETGEEETEENTCPHGYTFGEDTDRYDECAECSVVDDCGDVFDSNLKKRRERRRKKETKSAPEEKTEEKKETPARGRRRGRRARR